MRQSIVEAIPVDGSMRNGYAQAVLGMPSVDGYAPNEPYPFEVGVGAAPAEVKIEIEKSNKSFLEENSVEEAPPKPNDDNE